MIISWYMARWQSMSWHPVKNKNCVYDKTKRKKQNLYKYIFMQDAFYILVDEQRIHLMYTVCVSLIKNLWNEKILTLLSKIIFFPAWPTQIFFILFIFWFFKFFFFPFLPSSSTIVITNINRSNHPYFNYNVHQFFHQGQGTQAWDRWRC